MRRIPRRNRDLADVPDARALQARSQIPILSARDIRRGARHLETPGAGARDVFRDFCGYAIADKNFDNFLSSKNYSESIEA